MFTNVEAKIKRLKVRKIEIDRQIIEFEETAVISSHEEVST
jgi:hypothetical protein